MARLTATNKTVTPWGSGQVSFFLAAFVMCRDTSRTADSPMSTCWPPYLIAQSEGQRLSAVASGDFYIMLRFQPGIYPFQRAIRTCQQSSCLVVCI